MDDLFMILGFLLLFIGLPVSIVWLIVRIVKKKTVTLQAVLIPSCAVVSFIFFVIGANLYSQTDEYKQQIAEEKEQEKEVQKEKEELAQKEEELTRKEEELEKREKEIELREKENAKKVENAVTSTPKPTVLPTVESTKEPTAAMTEKIKDEISPTIIKEKEDIEDNSGLTEEEYKNSCTEMWYDDVFFSESSFKGKKVKLHLFLEEAYFFTADDMLSVSNSEFYSQNNLYRDFYKCGVLRKDENSYVGGQIDVFFNQDYGVAPSDYECGDKLIMYGEVVHCATATWSGYNQVYFIPKYVENEE